MKGISPQDMERYRSRLADFNLNAGATDEAIRALHLTISAIIDMEIRKASGSGLKDSFLTSANHANLPTGKEPKIVDLASEGAKNISQKKQGCAP